jgi:hypothetical protein
VWFSQEGLLRNRFSLSRLVFPADSCRTGISQPPAPSEPSASNARSSVIKTESRIVLVHAVVNDKKGNYLHALTQQDFRVYEDNKEQKIVSLSSGSEGLTEPQRG